MPRKYICRNCDFAYHTSKHDTCPACGTPPKSRNRSKPAEVNWETVAEIISMETQPDEKNQPGAEFMIDEDMLDNISTYETQPDEQSPSKQQVVGDYEATITKKGDRWTVAYEAHQVVNAWMNCPACGKKMFQNNILWGQLEDKCKCGAFVTFVFK